ncbi:hypothetical protein PV327_002031 [Microctonus hyperodae]|uniref:Uncharacterized protein n=1 Tax=Microctonus hyperodae TaxID=165561 RepID=A0AA39KNW6_MICHY|nr:hypothetical protein PV327_002031 [Microctonus hyperodae]
MARIQGNREDFLNVTCNRPGWKHFRDLSRDRFSSNEDNCNRPSSDPDISTKKWSKKSQISSEHRHEGDKTMKDIQGRKKFRDHYIKKLEQASRNEADRNPCDQPRKMDKSTGKFNTIKYSPSIMQVEGVEVIESRSMDGSRVRYPSELGGKIFEKNLKKKHSHRHKLISTKPSNTSVSSAALSVNQEKVIPRPTLSFNGINKNNYKVPKKIAGPKLKEKNCQHCDCLMETVKSPRVRTYPKYNRRREKSRERMYKRQELPRPLEEFAKKRGTMHKVRGECQMESWSPGSPGKTQKLCKILQTREAKQFMGCRCVETDDRENCFIKCQCPECPYDIDRIQNFKNIQQISDESTKRIIYNDSEPDPCELDSCIECCCEEPRLNNQFRNVRIDTNNRPNVKSGNLLHDTWQQCDKKLGNNVRQYRTIEINPRGIHRNMREPKRPGDTVNKCVTQRLIDKTFCINPRALRNNVEMPSIRTRDASTCSRKEKVINQHSQCDDCPTLSNLYLDKFNDDQDPVEAVASLCEKLKMINREVEPNIYRKTSYISCRTDECKCKPIGSLHKGKIESDSNIQFSHRKDSKLRVKHHQFTIPKIVKSENHDQNSDVPKVFVYSADDEDGSPLSLHKTGSFVKCAIKRNTNNGNKYYIAYIQKYVSPAWKTDENFETEIKSTEYLSSDDYG